MVLEHFRRDPNFDMLTIQAQDALVDETRKRDNMSMEKITPTGVNKTVGFSKELVIFVGAKVML